MFTSNPRMVGKKFFAIKNYMVLANSALNYSINQNYKHAKKRLFRIVMCFLEQCTSQTWNTCSKNLHQLPRWNILESLVGSHLWRSSKISKKKIQKQKRPDDKILFPHCDLFFQSIESKWTGIRTPKNFYHQQFFEKTASFSWTLSREKNLFSISSSK